MQPQLRLVQDAVSEDTIECLQGLLAQAKAGELAGVAYVAIHKDRGYSVNTTGDVARNPTFARGMLQALDDRLAGLLYLGR